MNDEYKQHKCKQLPENGVYITCQLDEPFYCTLYIHKDATEADLEQNHYLDIIGETIWSTSVEIIYCPYCGSPLLDTDKIKPAEYGEFQHINLSGGQVR